MKIKLLIITLIFSLFYHTYIHVEENNQKMEEKIITFFIREFPDINHKSECIKRVSLNRGIIALYAGMINTSNNDGQIVFPRRTQKEFFSLLITESVYPIFSFDNTIAYWEISNEKAKMYTIEKKEDESTHFIFWEIKQTDLPKNMHVPLNSITIIANPDHIYIPEGISEKKEDSQLLLPEIYVKKEIDHLNNALFMLSIRNFFSPVSKMYKDRPLGYLTLVTS